MRALILKEWRENRLLVLGFLFLAPLLSIGVKWGVVGWKDTLANHSVMMVIPGLLLLFVLGIAADLVAGDAGSGRIAFLAALPVRPGTVWAAKAAFLFGAATLYLGYLLLLESAILAAAGKGAGWLFANFDDRAGWLLAIAAIGAATLFFSTLIDRGLAAVFAGLTALAGIGLLVWLFDPPAYGLRWRREAIDLIPHVAILIGAAFLLGSFLAFARGRIHLGSRVRRVALAAAGFLLVAAPPAAWSAVALHDWAHVEADDPSANFRVRLVSPDCRWLVVRADRGGRKGPLGAQAPERGNFTFAVRAEDGIVRDLTGIGDLRDEARAFADPGRVKLFRSSRAPGERVVWLEIDYDLEAGETLSTRPIEGAPRRVWRLRSLFHGKDGRGRPMVVVPGRDPVPIAPPWGPTGLRSEWGIGVQTLQHRADASRRRFVYGVLDIESGEVTTLPHYPVLLPDTREGTALGLDKVLYRVPLDGGEPKPVPGVTRRWVQASPDGRLAAVIAEEGVFLFSADGGAPHRIADAVTPDSSVIWSEDSRSFLVRGEGGTFRGRIGEPGLTPYPLPEGREWAVMSFDGSRAICTRRATARRRSAILTVSENGEIRQLFPAE